jgi:D-sedoheptulose 7-phosphate isomerase
MSLPDSVESLIMDRLVEGADLRRAVAHACADQIQRAAAALEECLRRGNKVLTFGNGGSAADAQHFAAELIGRFRKERAPMPALALTTDTSALTAIGNDYGFGELFARQVRALAANADVVVAISTTGRSPNVVNGARAARTAGATTIAVTGGDGGELSDSVDIAIVVPSTDTARIQEVHIAVVHILCELIENTLFPLEDTISQLPRGVVRWEDLILQRDRWKQDQKAVVWTNGCFDVLHVGHLHCLEQARRLGDVLIVGVNTDAAVRAIKGQDRPIFPLEERMRVLAALRTTDYVVAFEGLTPEAALAELRPDVHVKGDDYAPPHGKPIPERELVESYGGRVEFVSLVPEHSTFDVIQRIRHRRTVEGE